MKQQIFCFSSTQLASLATIILKVKLLDIGDPRSILSTALSPPNLSDIVRTVLQLKEVISCRVMMITHPYLKMFCNKYLL